jgi:decaprenylphospho-beta-D-erythro-pentofuranosid-2-ulose 2-reductase
MTRSQHIAIFGATSAIAAELARCYVRRGAQLALVGRSADKLERLRAELGSSVVYARAQDFTDTAGAQRCVAEAQAQLGRVDIALIAHGLLGDQLASERDFAEAAQIAQVNYLSVLALLIPLANLLEAQQSGQLAVLSSVAAERGRPRNYTYAAAKGALNVYLQGLRSRLYPSGVTVHTLKLGPVDTPMTESHRKNLLFSSAPAVARHVLNALDRRVDEAFVPPFWALIMPVVRTLPEALFQRIGALAGR